MKIKNQTEIYIKIITPVHIGVANEKRLLKGIDFLVDETNNIYMLDSQKILSPPYGSGDFELDDYTNKLANGDLNGLLNKSELRKYSKFVISDVIGEIGNDIKTVVKNPLNDKPYIPGSSLKGAIRSIIFKKVKSPNDKYERSVFGKISEDPFRYLIIEDSFFNDVLFINTKTFSIKFDKNNNLIGGWKNSRKNNFKNDFTDYGFTFIYECIAPNNISKSKITFNVNSYRNALLKQKEIDKKNEIIRDFKKKIKPVLKENFLFDKLSKQENLEGLLIIIKEYTKNYINKEIAFFEKYSNNETGIIIEEYKRLLKLNEKAPLIRIGQGSGFHSITGDWQFESHDIDRIDFKTHRGLIKVSNSKFKKSAKTRKLAFTKKDGKIKFYPMGFIQLLTGEQAKEELEKMEKEREEKERKLREEKAKEIQKQKKREIEEQEAKKPHFRNYPSLNPKKRYKMDAVVSESGYPNKVDIYVKEGQIDRGIRLDVYSSPLEIGKVIIVEVSVSKKGKVTQASFKNFK